MSQVGGKHYSYTKAMKLKAKKQSKETGRKIKNKKRKKK